METTYQVNLMPIEPILFADNRSARAGEDHLIRDHDPSPHTIYSAIGAYIVDLFGAEIDPNRWDDVRPYLGDFVADIANGDPNRSELKGYFYSDGRGRRWFPRPLHIRLSRPYQNAHVGKPVQLVLQKQDALESSLKDFVKYLKGEEDLDETESDDYVSEQILQDILCGVITGGKELQPETDRLPLAQIYQPETRLGLGMDNDVNRPYRGLLFSRPYRRFHAKVDADSGEWRPAALTAFFKTQAVINPSLLAEKRVAFLGGDRGRALIELQPESEVSHPLQNLLDAVQRAAAPSDGFFCYLLTPAARETDWPAINGLKPIAAAIGKEKAISGWNRSQNQHPRPICKLIPAGSTFFYQWPDAEEKARRDLIEEYWLEPVTKNTTDHYRNSGFGRMLIGVWKNEN